MAWLPISGQVIQRIDANGDPANGYVLKLYRAGTTTNTVLATDSTGATTATDALYNATGDLTVSGVPIIPHIDRDYKLVIYPDQASADADTGAVLTIDNIKYNAALEGIDIGWQFVSDTGYLTIDPPAITADTTENTHRVAVLSTNAITVPAGTTPLVSSLYLVEPNIVATGTVTNAATLYIKDAPSEGTNNYALYVDAGTTRLDGELLLNVATQDYIFKAEGNHLKLEAQTAATRAEFELSAADNDGTDDVIFTIDSVGDPGQTDRELGQFMFDAANQTYSVRTTANGTGTVRPLSLYTGANTSQIVLNIDGSVRLGTTLELGHASDTTISRVSAGVIAVEGDNVIMASDLGTAAYVDTGTTTGTIPLNGGAASFTTINASDRIKLIGSGRRELALVDTSQPDTHEYTAFTRSGNFVFLQTLNSSGTFVSADYQSAIGASGATSHAWRIANVEKLSLDSTGLNVVDGISFDGGTNRLSDYAAGTFTPEVFDAATGGTEVGNYSTGQYGYYQRVGQMVTVQISLGSSVTGGASGTAYFRNLPFSVKAGNNRHLPSVWWVTTGEFTRINFTDGATYFTVTDPAGGLVTISDYTADSVSGGGIRVNFSYVTDDA